MKKYKHVPEQAEIAIVDKWAVYFGLDPASLSKETREKLGRVFYNIPYPKRWEGQIVPELSDQLDVALAVIRVADRHFSAEAVMNDVVLLAKVRSLQATVNALLREVDKPVSA